MPANMDLTFLPVIIIGIIALVAIAVVLAKKAREKTDRRMLERFGKIPRNDDYADMESIASYHHYYAKSIANNRRIDNTTWNDLNMDDIFLRINACSCSVGEEYLYHTLHELESQAAMLEKRERFMEWVAENPEKRLLIQKALMGIGKRVNNRLCYYLFHAHTKTVRFSWLYVVMALLPLMGLLLLPFSTVVGAVIALASIGTNIVVYYIARLTLESEFESIQYFAAVLHGAKKLHKNAGKELALFGFDTLSPLKPFQKLGGFIPGSTQQNLAEIEAFTIIFKAIFLIDLIRYNRVVQVMNKHSAELNKLYETIGGIDSGISAASYRASLQHHCVPEFQEQNTVTFTGVYHPLLADPVTNSANITNDCIITGSNASGKSTFIKAVAVNCILAQTIYTCCAKQYRFSFSYIATSMALRDNILSGESYFITEIKSLRRIIQYCQSQQCIVFIDEILRGTNTPERIAASTAVLKQLHQTGSLCVVASHDIELTRLLAGVYDNYHFSERFADDLIEFDYLIKEGPSRSTNAIKLLEHMGFDQAIVEEAAALVKRDGGSLPKEIP